jgi:uncharacterized membrane protein
MTSTLLIHVIAGGLGLLSGYVALYAAKGAATHRRAGILFVCVMLTMSVTGLLLSAIQGVAPALNIPLAMLTFYLVTTSLVTVRTTPGWSRSWDVAAMLFAVGVGVASLALGVFSIARGGAEAGLGYPLFLFGPVALAAAEGDRRVLRTGALKGKPRLVRHLWRMCFALFIASIAFYLGPGRVPAALRSPALLAAGVLTPIAAMAYWRWRLRTKRSFPGLVGVHTREAI